MTTAREGEKTYYAGTGKRKTAVAQVRLYPGPGQVAINGRTLDDAIPWPSWQGHALEPLRVTETMGQFSVIAKLHGGGHLRLGRRTSARPRSRPARTTTRSCGRSCDATACSPGTRG